MDQRLKNLEIMNHSMLKILHSINANLSILNVNLKDKTREVEEDGVTMEEKRPESATKDKMQIGKDCDKEIVTMSVEELMSIKEAVEAIQVLDKSMSKD
jgi:hypothetical protein